MADDNKLPKPITVTGTVFNDVPDKVKTLDEEELQKDDELNEELSEDSDALPQPVVFGDDDEEEDDSPTTFTRKDLGKDEELPKPTPIIPDDLENETALSTETESISSKLDSDESQEIEAPDINNGIITSDLPSVQNQLDSITIENRPQDTLPISLQSEDNIIKEEDLKTPNLSEVKSEEDKTKLPETELASINHKTQNSLVTPDLNEKETEEAFEIPSIDLSSSDANLDFPPEDSPVMSPLAGSEDKEGDELTNRDELVNPYTPDKIQEAQKADQLTNMKDVVDKVAQLNDTQSPQAKNSAHKVVTTIVYVALGVGLMTGGYYAANSLFGPASKEAQILVQEEAKQSPTATPTPITEEEPPATFSPKPAASSPSATSSPTTTPEAITKDDKYIYVLIKDTPTDWLNARSTASTKEDNVIKKVYPGDTFEYLGSTSNGWFQIKLDTGEEAWISGAYAQRLTQIEYDNLDSAADSPTPSPSPEAEEEALEE